MYLLGLATGLGCASAFFYCAKKYDGTLSLIVDNNGDRSYKLSIHDVDKIPEKKELIISVETEIRDFAK